MLLSPKDTENQFVCNGDAELWCTALAYGLVVFMTGSVIESIACYGENNCMFC